MRLHIGTAEVLATVAILAGDELNAGEHGHVQLFLRDEIAAVWNQPFVIRSESPVLTIGGGRVLVPNAKKIRKPTSVDLAHLETLAKSDDESARVASAIYFAGLDAWEAHDLPRLAGAKEPAKTVDELLAHGQLVAIEVSPRRTAMLQQDYLTVWNDRILIALARLHEEFPMRSAIDTAKLTSNFAYLDDPTLLTAIVKQMAKTKQVRLSDRGVAHKDHQLKLSKPQQVLLGDIIQRFELARFQPPTVAEYQKELPQRSEDIAKLIQIAVAEEQLVHITKDMYLHASAERELRDLLSEALSASEGLAVSDIRELLGTTRKFAVPICEYLDRSGFTRRQGDVRVLA